MTTAFERALAQMTAASAAIPAMRRRALAREIRREASALRLKPIASIARYLGNSPPISTGRCLERAELLYNAQTTLKAEGSFAYDFNRLVSMGGIVVELRRRMRVAMAQEEARELEDAGSQFGMGA